MKQGTRSNVSGAQLEDAIKQVLIRKGFRVVKYKEYESNPNYFQEELLLEDVPYTSIYGHQGKTEFLLVSKKYNLRTRIECKWQQTSGSVDEKLPYLYLNAIEAMPEKQIILIIDGDGWKKGAIKWLEDAIQSKKYMKFGDEKEILLLDLKKFFSWANKTFTASR